MFGHPGLQGAVLECGIDQWAAGSMNGWNSNSRNVSCVELEDSKRTSNLRLLWFVDVGGWGGGLIFSQGPSEGGFIPKVLQRMEDGQIKKEQMNECVHAPVERVGWGTGGVGGTLQ